MRYILLIGAALCLAACGTTGSSTVTTVAQTSEKVDTEAADIYVAIATYENADEAATPANVTKDEAFKLKAWQDYSLVHTAYLAGTVLTDVALATLTLDQSSAKAQ